MIMSIRKTSLTFKENYHIYNRGNSKQTIFHDQEDYFRFIKLLFLSNGKNNFKIHLIDNNIYDFDRGEQIVDIGAYCLMPNHFHLLVKQTSDEGISKFMQKISTGYSMYYNKKYKRTGGLFEGKFKSKHAGKDNYLKYLFSYIHLNPIKLIDPEWKENGIKDKGHALSFLDQYKFSSYQDFSGSNRPQNKIINTNAFPNYFSNKDSLKNEIFDWLSYKE